MGISSLHGVLFSVCFNGQLQVIQPIQEDFLWNRHVIIFRDSTSAAAMFHEGWLMINGVSSHVLTWGGWVEDPTLEGDAIILFMCGVPGITLFYQNFLDILYNQLKIPVWTICIAGHEIPPASSNLELTDDAKLYDNVEAQVAHKLAFIRDYVPKNRRIYLIGHSFGAKMVTELLKDEQVCSQADKCLLLMPTLERFSETPRAKFWLTMTNTGLIYSIVAWSWLLSVLPLTCTKVFIYLYFQSRGLSNVPECCYDAMAHFCNPTIFNNVRALVWNELDAIKNLDIEVLTRLKDKIKVYFAHEDSWAPLTHYDTLKTAVPELSVEVLEDKFIHAFTLDNAEDMARILLKDLKSDH